MDAPAHSSRRLTPWLLLLAAGAAVAVILATAHFTGSLTPVYQRMGLHALHDEPHQAGGPQPKASGAHTGHAGHGGMNMPGMEETPPPGEATPSAVAGLATVQIKPELQQRIGVTVGQVEKAPLRMQVRTVGIVRPNETQVARVHLRTEGWIKKLFVNFTGKTVNKGDPLLSIYSPQFLATQQEYLAAVEGNQESLAELARNRLELWGVPREAIQELRKTRKPQTNLTLRSPITGTVLEKNAFEDQYVTPEKELYVIADLATVWVQAKVYEYELPHVELGQPATVTVPALPGQEFAGKVVFIQPTVEESARTVQVRVELPNRDGAFKPGMFAHITIAHTMGEGLLVPAAAVIRTGTRDYVFRAEADNRFVPALVTIDNYTYEHRFHVLTGLKEGERVVTSADFLIDSESRLDFGAGGTSSMPGMPGMEHSPAGH
jgi:Cu(I)/Ag(I) efflux system membrane fusion protein